MYRRSLQKEPSPAPPAVLSTLSNPNHTATSKYDLLWRKRSRKVHKTWEGDATGTVVRNGSDFSLSIAADGISLGTAKLGPDLSSLETGNILNAGSIEVEIGECQNSRANSPKRQKSAPPNLPATNLAATKFGSEAIGSSKGRFSEFTSEGIGLRKGKFTESPTLHARLSSLPAPSLPNPCPSNPCPSNPCPSNPSPAELSSPTEPDQLATKPVFLNSGTFSSANRAFTVPFADPQRITNSVPHQLPPSLKKLRPNAISTPMFVNPQRQSAPPATDLLPQLRPHQVEAVKFMKACVLGQRHRYGNGAILADEMGLGKTLSSIALISNLLSEKHILNALIVCPVSLVGNWRQEFTKWLPPTINIGIMVIDKHGLGNGSLKTPALTFFNDLKFRAHQVLVVGYERVRTFASQLAEAGHQFDLVICDEGHRLKRAGSQTVEAVASIAGDKRIILSGTPIQNDLSEFWALMNFVNPQCLPTESQFNRRFAQPIDFLLNQDPNSLEIDTSEISGKPPLVSDQRERAEQALADLTMICNEVMLRRTAEIAQKYISVPQFEYVVFVRPTAEQILHYQRASHQAQSQLDSASSKFDAQTGLQTISELRKIAAGNASELGGKMRFLNKLVDIISTTTLEKIVIVSGSTRVLDLCQSMLVGKHLPWLRLDGQTPAEKRTSSVRIFNQTPSSSAFAFLLSSRSGGAGLNLVGGSRLVLVDGDWNPAVDLQAMARIYRDGQTQACHIYRLVTTGTIEEKIFQRQLGKLKLSRNVLLDLAAPRMAGFSQADFSKEVLRDLFTLSIPQKCNTLDVLGECGEVRGYTEAAVDDEVLQTAANETQSVSCVLTKQQPATK